MGDTFQHVGSQQQAHEVANGAFSYGYNSQYDAGGGQDMGMMALLQGDDDDDLQPMAKRQRLGDAYGNGAGMSMPGMQQDGAMAGYSHQPQYQQQQQPAQQQYQPQPQPQPLQQQLPSQHLGGFTAPPAMPGQGLPSAAPAAPGMGGAAAPGAFGQSQNHAAAFQLAMALAQSPAALQLLQQQQQQRQQQGSSLHQPQQTPQQQQQLQQQLQQLTQQQYMRNTAGMGRPDASGPRPPLPNALNGLLGGLGGMAGGYNANFAQGMGGLGGMGNGFGGTGRMHNPLAMQGQHQLQQLMQQRVAAQQAALQAQRQAAQKAAEPEEDKEEDILAKVGKISEKLRSMLGKSVTDKGYSGTAEASEDKEAASPSIVKREHLLEACGPIAQQIKSYQLVGINFLMMLHKSESVGGAILADEMGLGKTAQTITFLGTLRTMLGNLSPHLVVCPASLIQNWAREFKTWCPGLRVLVYHGKDRDQAREALQRWRKRVRTAHKEGRIAQLPPGMLLAEEEDAREDARAEAAAHLRHDDEEDAPDYAEEEEGDGEGHLGHDWDDSRPVGGLVLPGETSGQSAFDIMLTTYTLFEREGGYKADRAFLLKWKWCYMVADEAHALKNRSSIRTRKLRKVAAACESRILLTGTPLQNSLEELRALLEFLMPSLFMDPSNPDQEDTKDDELHMRKLDEEEQAARVERYKALLAPFILRRLKSEVATQLISKKHVIQEIEMTPEQGQLYRTAVENMRREVAAAVSASAVPAKRAGRPSRRGAAGGDDGAGSGGGSRGATPPPGAGGPTSVEALVSKLGSQRVNNIFTHLRKVAQHPLLVRNKYTDEQVHQIAEIASTHRLFGGNCSFERVYKELSGYSDHQLHNFSCSWPSFLGQYMLDTTALMSSAKIRCLDELLQRLFADGSKVLLFSQWTMTLDLLEWYMQTKGFTYVRLDGNTQVEERLSLVDKFNEGSNIFCFLLSTRAGGQGLNLTGADVVVLHDVDFNPQVDRQAEDRCHRLGQTKPVTVYRLVTKNTVDQNVLAIADRKLALDAAVLNDVTIGAGQDGEGEGEEGGSSSAAPSKKKKAPDAKEVRHMGAILSALLSGE